MVKSLPFRLFFIFYTYMFSSSFLLLPKLQSFHFSLDPVCLSQTAWIAFHCRLSVPLSRSCLVLSFCSHIIILIIAITPSYFIPSYYYFIIFMLFSCQSPHACFSHHRFHRFHHVNANGMLKCCLQRAVAFLGQLSSFSLGHCLGRAQVMSFCHCHAEVKARQRQPAQKLSLLFPFLPHCLLQARGSWPRGSWLQLAARRSSRPPIDVGHTMPPSPQTQGMGSFCLPHAELMNASLLAGRLSPDDMSVCSCLVL